MGLLRTMKCLCKHDVHFLNPGVHFKVEELIYFYLAEYLIPVLKRAYEDSG